MLSFLTALALLSAAPQEGVYVIFLGDPTDPKTRLSYSMTDDKLPEPRLSPKTFGDPPQPFQFDWVIRGDGKPADRFLARFLVFSQERKSKGDKASMVVRQLLRMWDFNVQRLGRDHHALYEGGVVNVFLCWGGTAGGEQLFDQETRLVNGTKVDVKMNTIYIYDLTSFKDPVEMAREVAHEYGHATLPAVGGFKTPEDWGNGYLGEKLFLRYLRNEVKAGRIPPEDVMGATADQLDQWVKKHADPLETKVAKNGPELSLLEGEGLGPINEYVGLTLWMQTVMPPNVFTKALYDSGSTAARDFGPSLVRTVENWPTGVVLSFPPAFKSGAWVPVGKCRVAGGSVEKRKGDWSLVKPGAGVVTLVPPKL